VQSAWCSRVQIQLYDFFKFLLGASGWMSSGAKITGPQKETRQDKGAVGG